MQSTTARAALAVVLVAVAVVLFVVLRDSDDGGGADRATGSDTEQQATPTSDDAGGDGQQQPPPPPPIPTVAVRDGETQGGVLTLEYTSGDRIRFRVRSDEAGEVHVHGYEITEPVRSGGSVTLAFPADLEGGYEVELHGQSSGEFQIAELVVNPD